ncbi:MAG: hypothetical protein FWF33_04220 [Clostridiales bacterium]|nr:hypothetical protein [Clostridiales bacterium]
MKAQRGLGWLFYAIGFAVPFIASGYGMPNPPGVTTPPQDIGVWNISYTGMPIQEKPWAFAVWLVCWIIGFFFFYKSFPRRPKMIEDGAWLWRRVCNFISDWTSMFLLSVFLTAMCFFPSAFAAGLPAQQMNWVAASLVVMGMSIPLDQWKRILKRPLPVIQVWILRWVCMPLLALGIGYLIYTNLISNEAQAQMLITAQALIGTTATGGASNVYTFIAGGDAPMSILCTTLSTLTDPLIQPGMTKLLVGQMLNVPVAAMMLELVEKVVLPLVVGILISTFILKNRAKQFAPLFSAVAVVVMLPMFMGAVSGGWNTLLHNLILVPVIALAAVIHAGAGMSIGYFGTKKIFKKFTEPQNRSGLFEVGVENISIASGLANNYFPGEGATLGIASTACALYGLVQTVLVMIVINIFKSRDTKAGHVHEVGSAVASDGAKEA